MENLNNLRHSCAHLLAAAVMELWPATKRTIGPSIENGFYYDFDFENPISEEDLPKIEKQMAEMLPSWNHFEHKEISETETKKLFKDNPYKLELINEIVQKGEPIAQAQEELFGKGLILTVIPETLVIFGLVVAILIMGMAA